MIVLVELDWRGSWRPRSDNIGAGIMRYIGGPFSVLVFRGGFRDLMTGFEQAAAEKLLQDAVRVRLARRNLTA